MSETTPTGCARSINVTYCLVMEGTAEFGEVYASLQLRKDRHPVGSAVRERLLCLLDKLDVEFGKYQQEEVAND